MEKVILIKYAELNTKGDNRSYFINTLYKNVKDKLDKYECSILKERSNMTISFKEKDLDSIIEVINHTFGIHSYQLATICDSEDEAIKDTILEVAKGEKFKTFKVEVKRSNKKFPIKSMEYVKVLGGTLLKNIDDIKVDVHNPDLLFKVEIRDKKTYIYTNTIRGLGGYPVGVGDKALGMLSGGIDSPVAMYLAMKRGITVDCVYFEAIPHTSLEAREKVISLTKKLVKYTNKINLYIVNFTKIQEAIYKNCDKSYTITIMRRMMYRIMEELTKKYKAKAIINGESVGQVASQTLSSMGVINSVTNLPVIRPVACLDKLEIIDLAKRIDTYDTSILPYEDCCTIFVPKHPVINPKLEKAREEEVKFDYKTLIEKTVNSIKKIEVTEEEQNDLL
ncbi:MAG: tRNA 4-thiouridine(8) synthase ThiI [Bacilli bacterium]|nr:tRNA 4-thiouridine(8) synthase ThiI [Bacilli bacterium]